MMKSYQITEWCHEIIKSQVQREGIYIDATMGNGYDTAFFCELAGEKGKVYAFDIQELAAERTGMLLEQRGLTAKAQLILDSHANMEQYIGKEKADCICFNFGYLPGGNHAMATKPDTSVRAIRTGLDILKEGGLMSLCIYSGGDTGFEERDAILEELRRLDSRRYLVIVNSYYNRGNHPPIPVFIFKN